MSIIIQPYDIGCEASPSVPSETVLQDGWATYLLFFAVSKTIDESTGYLKDLGVAVVECEGCSSTKFGYPNDEGLPEHPLYSFGMADTSSTVLVAEGTPWLKEVLGQQRASTERIWGSRGIARKETTESPQRHFIVPLKEATFECIATSLKVVLYAKNFNEAHAYVWQRFSEH